jgi:hypothetical protein
VTARRKTSTSSAGPAVRGRSDRGDGVDVAGGRVVIDPLVPGRAALVRLIADMDDIVLHRPDPRRVPHPAYGLVRRPIFVLGVAVFGGSGALLMRSPAEGGVLAGIAALTAGFIRWVLLARRRAEQQMLVEAGGHYVVVHYLPGAQRDLLDRARTAARTVRGSRARREGLVDPLDSAVALDEEVWAIAAGLRDVADLAESRTEGAGDAGDARRVARDERLAAVEARIVALEEWARQTGRVDAALDAAERERKAAGAGGAETERLWEVRAAAEADAAGRREIERRATAAADLAGRLGAQEDRCPKGHIEPG